MWAEVFRIHFFVSAGSEVQIFTVSLLDPYRGRIIIVSHAIEKSFAGSSSSVLDNGTSTSGTAASGKSSLEARKEAILGPDGDLLRANG